MKIQTGKICKQEYGKTGLHAERFTPNDWFIKN